MLLPTIKKTMPFSAVRRKRKPPSAPVKRDRWQPCDEEEIRTLFAEFLVPGCADTPRELDCRAAIETSRANGGRICQ